jgi:hypothetical protein
LSKMWEQASPRRQDARSETGRNGPYVHLRMPSTDQMADGLHEIGIQRQLTRVGQSDRPKPDGIRLNTMAFEVLD